MNNTQNFDDFGKIEIEKATNLLKAYSDNNMTDRCIKYLGSKIKVEFNPMSGYVFLVDEDYNCAMLTDEGELDLWLSTPYDGHEGFFDELLKEYDEMHKEDKEYMKQFDINNKIKEEDDEE